MTRPKKSSLADVARAAGVSSATVSRVLNGTGPVRTETREIVMRAVTRLRYTIDLQASTLAGAGPRTIGVIVSNLDNPFFLDVYRSVEAEAHRLGHEVLVANTGYDPDRLVASVNLMLGRRVSGIAAIVSEMAPAVLTELIASGVPVAVYDVGGTGANVINIRVDYAAGMQQVITELYGLGHRRFAFVGHHTTLTPLSVRQHAFLNALQQYGRRVSHQIVTETDALDGGRRAAHYLLDAPDPPTAVVCVNDLMAAGVLRTLRERHIRVPNDISVTGFDNVTLAEYVAPSLTTVDIPRDEIGRLAIGHLTRPAPRGRGAREIIITPTLVVRESTGRAKKGA